MYNNQMKWVNSDWILDNKKEGRREGGRRKEEGKKKEEKEGRKNSYKIFQRCLTIKNKII